MSVRETELSHYRQTQIKSLVSNIRRARGVRNTNNRNLNFKSVNTSRQYNSRMTNMLDELYGHLVSDLPSSVLSQINAARLFIRYKPNISRIYASQQTLHFDITSNPTEGEAFMQFIYYIDTPQLDGRNAPIAERGILILNPLTNNRTIRTVVPQQGRIVYFPPNLVAHEVAAPLGNYTGNVSRNMVIGMLYRKTTNTRTINQQVRPFSQSYVRAVRAISGVNLPVQRGNLSLNNNNFIRMMRGLTTRQTTLKRPAPNRNENPRVKRRRLG